MARCHSGGSAPGFSQRLCQMFWQNQAGTRPGVRTDWRGTSQRPHLRPAETAALPWTSRFGRSRGGRQRGPGSWRLPSAACTCAVGELAHVRNSELAKCGNLDRATTRASHAPRPQGAPQPAQEIAGSQVVACRQRTSLSLAAPSSNASNPWASFRGLFRNPPFPTFNDTAPSRTARSGGVLTHLPHSGAPLGPLAGPARCLSLGARSHRGGLWIVLAERGRSRARSVKGPLGALSIPAHLGQRE
jgi:hypothetical protein